MITDARLFSVRDFEFRRSHLLVIGILIIAFSLSSMIRFQGADYGFELNEFDPYFNYRATEFLVENGLEEYYEWHDYMSWYPNGRDVSATSQIMLHITAAATYYLFGGGMDLLSFIIIFPAVVGALTAVVVFALVRTIGGTGAGLFAALFFAISPAIIVRGTMGWFKSEPMGLFYGLLAMYLFLSGIRSADRRVAAAKVAAGGLFLSFGLASWGGIQYFAIPIAIFILALPFFRSDHRFLLWIVPLFGAAFLSTVLLFERPGLEFVAGLGGITIVVPTILMAAIILIKTRSGAAGLRNSLIFLLGSFAGSMLLLYVNSLQQFIPLPSFRYLNAVNPFLTTIHPLVDSVAEHATADTGTSFWFLSVLMIFAGIGAWLLLSGKINGPLREKPEMAAFALILGITGVYVSSAFVRLEIFAAMAVIILSALALSIISGMFFHPENPDRRSRGRTRNLMQAFFVAAIVMLLIIPTVAPADGNWITGVKAPPTILNGGTSFGVVSNDWHHALEWIRTSTPPDSIVAAWWDYGYWITTLGERTTLADNFTSDDKRIADLARMMLSHPDDAWAKLQELKADYVLIFIAALGIGSEPPTYVLNGGGDEQKNYWFIRIAEEPLSRYLHEDQSTETNFFWENTMLGSMIPFSPRVYINPETGEQAPDWQPNTLALLEKNVKLPADGDGPLRLAYSSPSFAAESGPIVGVFIYEVNQDYVPGQAPPVASTQGQLEIATISTGQGEIGILLDRRAQPELVEGFVAQADAGAYNGAFFHRVVPGILLQGGSPGAALPASAAPGFPAGPTFDDFADAGYLLAAARGSSLGGADPQFFIIDSGTPWIADGYVAFGSVFVGDDVIDAISGLETDDQNEPLDLGQAEILEIRINSATLP